MFRQLVLALLLFSSSVHAAVPAVPTGLTSTGYVNNSIPLAWTYSTSPVIPSQWYVYVNGTVGGSPTRNQVAVNGSVVTWTLTGIPPASLPASIYLKALSSDGVSSGSTPIVVTGTSSTPTVISGTVDANIISAVPLTVTCTNCAASPGYIGVSVVASVPLTVSATLVASGIALPVSVTAFDPTVNVVVVSGGGQTSVSLNAGTNYVGAVNVSNGADAAVQIAGSITNTVTVGTHAVTQGGPWTVSGSAAITNFVGVTLVASSLALPVSVTAFSVTPYVNVLSTPQGTSLPAYTAAAPLPVSLTTITNSSPLPVSATLAAVYSAMRTSSGGVDALNSAPAFDYDANNLLPTTMRGATTTTLCLSTSGTTAVNSGATILYGWGITNPSTVAGSTVTLFDGAVTKQVLSAEVVVPYVVPRGMAFTTGLTVVVKGTAFDGAFWGEWRK